MSKPKHPRVLADTEAQAIVSNLRVSPRKLNLVAGLIRNQPAKGYKTRGNKRTDSMIVRRRKVGK